MPLTVIPIIADRINNKFELFAELQKSLAQNCVTLYDGDVLVVSTKYVSNSEGRIISLDSVKISKSGRYIAKTFGLRPQLAELILRESDSILGGITGFLMAVSNPLPLPPVEPATGSSLQTGYHTHHTEVMPRGVMAPNAGIDLSNAEKEHAILYPAAPYETAELLHRKIFLELNALVGVILVDSRLMPARTGTSGVAIAYAGIEPVRDMRSKLDLNGNPLKVTFQATADNLATIANHEMGEGSESRPFAIVRNSGVTLTSRRTGPSETVVAADQCVYVRGLSGGRVSID